MTVDRNQDADFARRVDHPFWEGLGAGEVRIQRCLSCARWMWPADWRCGACGSWDMGWETVPGHGTVHAWERTHQRFVPEFADMLPYVNILVELTHAGGRHILGLLLPPHDGVRIGSPVVAAIQPPTPRTRGLPALWWRLAGAAGAGS